MWMNEIALAFLMQETLSGSCLAQYQLRFHCLHCFTGPRKRRVLRGRITAQTKQLRRETAHDAAL